MRTFYFTIFLSICVFCTAQKLQNDFDKRMASEFDFWSKNEIKFSYISMDTTEIYEIEFYTFDALNLHQKCASLNFFSFKSDFKNIKNILKYNSFIKLGVIYEGLRPSLTFNQNKKNYKLDNLNIRDSTTFSYKINDNEYFRIFRSTAIVNKYHSGSKNWFKYYFPLQKIKAKEFDYFEIVKILHRDEIVNNSLSNYKRVSFICNAVMY